MRNHAVILTLLLCVTGCRGITSPSLPDDAYQAEADATVVMAFVAATQSESATPDGNDAPKVGDKCPQCNDPPGKCGVGRVGDGVICNPCRKCGGDGRIDAKDLTPVSALPAIKPKPVEVARSIILNVQSDLKSNFAKRFWTDDRPYFVEQGIAVTHRKGGSETYLELSGRRTLRLDGEPKRTEISNLLDSIR